MTRKLLERLPDDFAALLLLSKERHRIWHRVLDRIEPKMTRWRVQLPLQSNCVIGWYGLKGFTDEAAIEGEWHCFEVKGRARVRAFLKATAPLLRQGLIEVEVDGRKVALAPAASRPRSNARRVVARAVKPAERVTRKARA